MTVQDRTRLIGELASFPDYSDVICILLTSYLL